MHRFSRSLGGLACADARGGRAGHDGAGAREPGGSACGKRNNQPRPWGRLNDTDKRMADRIVGLRSMRENGIANKDWRKTKTRIQKKGSRRFANTMGHVLAAIGAGRGSSGKNRRPAAQRYSIQGMGRLTASFARIAAVASSLALLGAFCLVSGCRRGRSHAGNR